MEYGGASKPDVTAEDWWLTKGGRPTSIEGLVAVRLAESRGIDGINGINNLLFEGTVGGRTR